MRLSPKERVVAVVAIIVVPPLIAVFRIFHLEDNVLIGAVAWGALGLLLVARVWQGRRIAKGALPSPTATATCFVDASESDIRARVLRLINTTRGWRLLTTSVRDSLEIETRASFRSFGERLVINLTPDGPSSTRIDIVSVPKLEAVLADYGKNAENVRSVLRAVGGKDAAR